MLEGQCCSCSISQRCGGFLHLTELTCEMKRFGPSCSSGAAQLKICPPESSEGQFTAETTQLMTRPSPTAEDDEEGTPPCSVWSAAHGVCWLWVCCCCCGTPRHLRLCCSAKRESGRWDSLSLVKIRHLLFFSCNAAKESASGRPFTLNYKQ